MRREKTTNTWTSKCVSCSLTTPRHSYGIKQFGSGCFLAKTDIESAFRLILIHPDDYELLGMCWEGKYYYDKVLPFGLRSAPSIFNRLSDALEWILLHKCNISFVCHILDDFFLIEPSAGTLPLNRVCQQSLTKMVSTFENIRIPIAPGKTQGPSQVLEFLGILLDTINMKASLPPEKLSGCMPSLSNFNIDDLVL